MSALREYKRHSLEIHSHPRTELHAGHVDACDLADAAIAEMEGKLERANRRKANTEWNAMVSQSDENLARAEQAEAAMVTLIDDYNRDFAKPLIDDERKRAERAEAESARLRDLWAKADAEEWERMR